MVRSGDTLWSIARESGVPVSEIRAINAIGDSRIFEGQLLQLPTR
jgi:LysM repeat protein